MMLKLPTVYSQRGEDGNTILGYNNLNSVDEYKHPYSIYWYGCLITSLGNIVGKRPGEINQILCDNKGFTTGSGNLIWTKVNTLGLNQLGVSVSYAALVTDAGIQKIKDILDQHHPLICEIDFNPATPGEDQHFVVIVGYDDTNIYIHDPWTGNYVSLDVYGGAKRAIIQYRWYDITLPDTTSPTSLQSVDPEILTRADAFIAICGKLELSQATKDAAIAKIESLYKQQDELEEQNRIKESKLTETKTQLESIQIQTAKDKEKIITISDQLEKIKIQVSDLQTSNESLASEVVLARKVVEYRNDATWFITHGISLLFGRG